MGRISDGDTGFDIFGMGWIMALFHCDGTVPSINDEFYRYVNDLLMTEANSLINQKGTLSDPDAVAVRWSRELKT